MKKSVSILTFCLLIFFGVVKAQHISHNEVLSRYYKAHGIEKMYDWQTITPHFQSLQLPDRAYLPSSISVIINYLLYIIGH